MHGEINGIDWTHSKLPCYCIERMRNKAQFRSAVVTSPYPVQGALRTSSSFFMPVCSKRILTAISVQIGRISERPETG
jgi:hypothetical protein